MFYFHSFGQPAGVHRGNHRSSGCELDEPGSAQCDVGGVGVLHCCRYVLQDRAAKFCAEFRQTLAAGGVKCLRLPPRSPNLNAFAECWVRSVKEECLSKLILFGEASLRRALTQFQEHYHSERNHREGQRSVIPSWRGTGEEPGTINRVQRAPRGLLKYSHRRAA